MYHCRAVSITDSIFVDLGIHTFLLSGTTRNITFNKMSPSIRNYRVFDRWLRRQKLCRRSPGDDTRTLLRLRRVYHWVTIQIRSNCIKDTESVTSALMYHDSWYLIHDTFSVSRYVSWYMYHWCSPTLVVTNTSTTVFKYFPNTAVYVSI